VAVREWLISAWASASDSGGTYVGVLVSGLAGARWCCDFFFRISAGSRVVLLTFSEEPDLAGLEEPSGVFACLVLVLVSSWMSARFEKDDLRSLVELLRAFFLISALWLCLRGFDSP